MFVVCRKLSGKERCCVLICQSIRDGKKVKQKTLRYFGVAHGEAQKKALLKEARKELKELSGGVSAKKEKTAKRKECSDPCGGALLGQVVEKHRVIEGFHAVFGSIFDGLNLSSELSRIRYEQLKDVVIARIAQPCSKLRTARMLEENFLRSLSVDQIYQLMDKLTDLEDLIKLKVFEATRKLYAEEEIDLLCFDVTTLYFESQKSDELRDFGYSKDHKVGETQVVLALATTKTGLPIGYHLFQGNTAETHTLLVCLEEWKKTFKIKNVIIVADRAMMSEANLLAMEAAGFTYIVAAKLKGLKKPLKEKILGREKTTLIDYGEEKIAIQEHTIGNRRLVVSDSPRRAEKDAKDLERRVEKLRSKMGKNGKANPQKLVSKKGCLGLTEEETKGVVVISEKKIKEEERWNGLHGIITNDLSNSALSLLQRYGNLWVIEESFRINKHTLAMRPIYHFSVKRIKAHILICYLAFAITRHAHQRIKSYEADMSIEGIRDALASVETSIVEDKATGEVYKIPSAMKKEARAIYAAMGVSRSEVPEKYVRMK